MKAYEKEKDENAYEEMLTDAYGTVDICGMTFNAGYALRQLDPTAFRCGLADEPIIYVCGECSEEYEDDEEQANECCNDDV